MRPRVLRQIAATTLREFLRSREAVFWTYGFPVLMAVVLGLAFSRDEVEPLRIGVAEPAAEAAWQEALDGRADLALSTLDVADAGRALTSAQVDLVVRGTPAQPELAHDDARRESRFARLAVSDLMQRRAGREDPIVIADAAAPEWGAERYIDLLIPGLIGLNLLGAGLWGIGFNLVDMRSKHLLRRLVVAPMRRAEFLFAFLLSRLGLVVVDALLILLFGMLAFGVPVRGSWFLLLALFALCGFAFSGLGLVVASRPRTIEGVSGLMNLVTLPMWLLCGSFFKTSYFPEYLQPVVQALPLTHANEAMRGVMLHGHGIAELWPELTYLLVFSVAVFGLALRWFRWT